MQETSLHFYHTKVKLNLQIIIFFPFMIGGYYMAYMGMVERSILTVLMALFFAILFSCFWGAAILKIVRSHPRSEEHPSALQSRFDLVCRLLLEAHYDYFDIHSFPTRRSSDLTKVKLNLQIIIFFPFMIGGYYMAYMGMVERSILTVLMALFFAILFSCFWGAAILKIVRSHP